MSVGRLQRYSNAFANVVADGIASNQITTGRTLENIQLKLGGTALTSTEVTDVKIKADGRVVLNLSGLQLDGINAFRGETLDAAFIDIPFADIRGMSEADRMVGAFDMSGVRMVTSEVTIAGATAPTLSAVTFESTPQKAGGGASVSGLISKYLRYPFDVSVGGQLPINLPFGPSGGSRVKRIHIDAAAGKTTNVTIKQDGIVVHESELTENEHELARWGLVPQTNWYSVDFVLDGNFLKWLDTRDMRTLELLPTFSGAESGFVIVEYVDQIGNL